MKVLQCVAGTAGPRLVRGLVRWTLGAAVLGGLAPVRADAAASAFAPHPATEALDRVFHDAAETRDFVPTGVTRAEYLKLVAGNVDFFKQYQDARGAIIDPYAKAEVQYATPAFALAASALVADAGRQDLLDPAARALGCAIAELAGHRAASNHADFFIPMIMHAHRLLAGRVPNGTRAEWDRQLRGLVPEKTYRMDLRGMNWNIVSSAGEFLRRKDGLVAPEQSAAQLEYLTQCLAGHTDEFTNCGMYLETGAPLAYDAFSRMWLEDLFAGDGGGGAYAGPTEAAAQWRQTLRLGALSGLLLLSPSGEWPNGGRSALHNWNEAETAAICEIEAKRWKADGRDDVAGAFKRAAHLAFRSMQRWQRPSGELWIVKNRAEPAERLGFEAYSQHSQYNLLPMAMLALAYGHADDAIAERPAPSEVGGYVFDVRDGFHEVAAAAGGYYVLINTGGDPHYTATGLQRVHRAGVAFPPLSDSTAAERVYGGPKKSPKLAMTPGIQWSDGIGGGGAAWRSLADFAQPPHKGTTDEGVTLTVKNAALHVERAERDSVAFAIDYTLDGEGTPERHLVERYAITSGGVECADRFGGGDGPAPRAVRIRLPALVSDGASTTGVSAGGGEATVTQRGSVLRFRVVEPSEGVTLAPDGPVIVAHNGLVRALVGGLRGPEAGGEVRWTMTLAQEAPPPPPPPQQQ